MALTDESARRFAAVCKRANGPKFRNRRVEWSWLKFDSVRELERWKTLSLMAQSGQISNLQRQVSFDLRVNNQLVCRYVADFSYCRPEGSLVIEDVKSPITARDRAYRIKKKLLLACHGIEITEVVK